MSRIIIAGGPRCGKSTLSRELGTELGYRVRPIDSLIGAHDWSSASEVASHWLDEPGPWIVEGVQAARVLRKWLARSPDGKPCDEVHLLTAPFVALTKGQEIMLRGVRTVWNEVAPELVKRGVELLPRDAAIGWHGGRGDTSGPLSGAP